MSPLINNRLGPKLIAVLFACSFMFACADKTQMLDAAVEALQSSDMIICKVSQTPNIPDRIKDKLFNTAVNVGVKRASILFQQSLNKVNSGSKLALDGKIGPATLTAMCNQSTQKILEAYVVEQSDFYKGIVSRKPSQKKFLNGWLRRAAWLPD